MNRHYLVTGGAGFIGVNYVNRLLARGEQVTVLDNLSRPGAIKNLEWLHTQHKKQFVFIKGDIRDYNLMLGALKDVDVVVHLAAQVAVTTSVTDPRNDFDINAMGTFNVLEAAREIGRKPVFIYASTNKVYGGMEDIAVDETEAAYRYRDYPLGIPENMPLDFHSPYGCSKGAGDQYVRDYHRIYGLPTVVFRQSCIYGTRQFGIEDQGWVAWFVIAALTGKPITIYGDGKQVRDVLFVDDLLDAYDLAIANPGVSAGKIYNIGGGPENVLSIWSQFGPLLESAIGSKIDVARSDWRPGDQKIYVSDIRKVREKLGWSPQVSVEDGIDRLVTWVRDNRHVFAQ